MGGLDGVVYCAGIDMIAPFEGMTDAAWDDVVDINLSGAMRTCRAALRRFPAQGGTIVLIASGAGLRPMAERAAYCTSKAGLVMLAKVLALEFGPRGLRVNAICPGAVDTDMLRLSYANRPDPEAELEKIRDRYALHRIAGAGEIAEAALFLTSEVSGFITGVALAVDGGRTFH